MDWTRKVNPVSTINSSVEAVIIVRGCKRFNATADIR